MLTSILLKYAVIRTVRISNTQHNHLVATNSLHFITYMIQLHVVRTEVHLYLPLCGPVGYIEFSQKSFK